MRRLLQPRLLAVFLLAVASCGGEREEREREKERPATPRRVSFEGADVVVTLDEAARRASDIAVSALLPASARGEARAYGTVVEIQTLAELRGHQATNVAQAEKARATLAASRLEYERLKNLYRDQSIVSRKDLEAVEAAAKADQATLESADSAVTTLASTVRAEYGAPLSDWILGGTPELLRLVSSREVLIQVTVPPEAASEAPRAATLLAPNGERLAARFVSRAARSDPRIQGPILFYVAPARRTLLPGTSTAAFLPVGPEVKASSVPEAAVVRWRGKAWVYVERDVKSFVRREISTDLRGDGGALVTSLPPGTRVVVRGAQLLLSEESRGQIQVGEEGGK